MSHKQVLERATKAWYLPRDLRDAIAALLADLRITKQACDRNWERVVKKRIEHLMRRPAERRAKGMQGLDSACEARISECEEILRLRK